jgi:hypothetical protein
LQKVSVECSRCHKIVEGLEEPGLGTSGFYRLTGFWKQFKRGEEEFLCDACMASDPKYKHLYPYLPRGQSLWALKSYLRHRFYLRGRTLLVKDKETHRIVGWRIDRGTDHPPELDVVTQ